MGILGPLQKSPMTTLNPWTTNTASHLPAKPKRVYSLSMINLFSQPVILRIGVLIALVGGYPSNSDAAPSLKNDVLCNRALNVSLNNWEVNSQFKSLVREAKRRGLSIDDCRKALGLAPLTSQANSNYKSLTSNLPACKGGNRHNCQGTLTFTNGSKYAGEFKDGKANGQGTATFVNGNKYVGEWKDDFFDGQGTFTFTDGRKYVGEWKDNKNNGQGTATFANGNKYVGEFKDDKRNGQGTYTWANGGKYVGDWKDDRRNGQGAFTWADGTMYVGGYKDDKRNGQGTFTIANGEKYVGGWKDDAMNGQGAFTFASGDKYVGEFKDFKRTGSITVSYAIGDAFSGNYISDKRQGQGTYLWKDGSKYVGQWAGGVPTVDGLHTAANGTVLRDVKYTNTATYDGDGILMSADVMTHEAPAVVAPQTVQVVQTISPVSADTGKRVALVIGNGSYKNVALLPNPPNDAEAMAAMLSGMGFDVVKGVDLDRNGMEKLIGTFAEKASDAKVSLFFYAGHAIQVDGKNYLMPIDAALKTATSVEFELLEVEQKIVRFMGGETAIILLDSCRDNPLKKEFAQVARSAKVSRGLAQISTDSGQQLIGFATSPGEVAEDGEGKNSPFTTALLKFLPTPGLEIEQAMKRVKNEVYEATGKKQMPWHNSAMRQDFFFVPAALSGTDAVITQTQPSQSATDPAAQAWGIIQNTTSVAVLDTFIKEYDASSIYVKIAKAKLEELRKSQIINGE